MEKRQSSILIAVALIMLISGLLLGYVDNGPKQTASAQSSAIK